mmetsp:Transcript_15617/g.23841  ORF Transcript_15617/g.23841 Transcript_15617/m.23841 type:complete len:89 (+) Transcript_15617:2-268(+)
MHHAESQDDDDDDELQPLKQNSTSMHHDMLELNDEMTVVELQECRAMDADPEVTETENENENENEREKRPLLDILDGNKPVAVTRNLP